ncbi:SEC-C metal-binding domain-containing protein [Desulfonatronospira sp.]|uniref:YecA family protein n=1 Tax=Desulfonatronospira sp. TaxID=1962951 RepID=UPI0025C6A698|nr:SEC-C metal-binding domain-containing protein [Desulfonatronospira sp.]
MTDEALLGLLRNTDRSIKAVSEIAPGFAQIPQQDLTRLMLKLIDEGEDKALGIFLNVIAYQRMSFDTRVLCQSLKVVDKTDDFIYPFREQDEKAIEPLLELAQAKDISGQRNVLAALLAVEFSVKYGAMGREVKKVLTKMTNSLIMPEAMLLIRSALAFLEDEESRNVFMPAFLEKDIHEELPESKGPSYIGQSHTVRRPVPKISRNAPCHCGSGKKHKKCCLEKDQELFHDASPYAGLTMSQVMSSPDLVDDTLVIDNMRAYQLKKLNHQKLKNKQLLAAYQKASAFGLYETGYRMLLELKGRPEQEDLAVLHLHDLLHAALDDGDLELSKIIEGQIPQDELEDEEGKKFHMFLLENKDLFMTMEKHCQGCLTNQDDFLRFNPVDMAYCFEKLFPALTIIFTRSAIIEHRTSPLDNRFLLDILRNARTDLDLEPLDDPIENYHEWSMDKLEQGFDLEAKDREIHELKQKIYEGRRCALEQDRELREKERELQTLSKKLEKEDRLKDTINLEQGQSHAQTGEQADVSHLKRRIERMKMEVREQQNERRRLSKLLEAKRAERIKTDEKLPHQGREKAVDEGHAGAARETDFNVKKVVIPVYTDQFRNSCEQISTGIVAKALRAIAGFAAHDQDVLRQSKRLERFSSVYRVRIGLYHRLLIRYEKEELKVLDLIHRQDLEKWIRHYSRGPDH